MTKTTVCQPVTERGEVAVKWHRMASAAVDPECWVYNSRYKPCGRHGPPRRRHLAPCASAAFSTELSPDKVMVHLQRSFLIFCLGYLVQEHATTKAPLPPTMNTNHGRFQVSIAAAVWTLFVPGSWHCTLAGLAPLFIALSPALSVFFFALCCHAPCTFLRRLSGSPGHQPLLCHADHIVLNFLLHPLLLRRPLPGSACPAACK